MPMLQGNQVQALVEALTDAYTDDNLRMMLRFRLDKRLSHYSAPNKTFPLRVFELVEASEREGWTAKLIAAARESNPGNPKLAELGSEVGLASTAKTRRSALERMVRDDTPFNNISEWLARWSELEAQVCRVEVYEPGLVGPTTGTGFLIGPEAVLTNHHVVAPVISGGVEPARVLCRFDYKRLADGMTLSSGSEFRLRTNGDWLVDQSPPSPEDEKVGGGLPDPHQLDYAVLRLEKKAGDLPVGTSPEPGAPKRGWIRIPESPAELQANDIVFLLQHPDGEPLMQSAGRVLSINDNKTRIRHDANTLGGSSGSPVFAGDLSLAALHHSGDPNYEKLHHPEYNQAVPFARIGAQLHDRRIPLPAEA